jgi:hypothetical protein
MRQAARIDGNHVQIVQALRSAGCSVQTLAALGKGVPDILVARAGKHYLIEIKSGTGKLTHDQFIWQRNWNGPVHTVRTIDEALQAVGAIKEAA